MRQSETCLRRLFVVCAIFATSALPVVADNSADAKPPQVRIVYSKLTGKWIPGKDTSGRYDLFLMGLGSSVEPRQLTNRSYGFGPVVWYPQFSPDGKEILFVANKSDSKTDLDLLESPTYRMQGTNLWRLFVGSNKIKPLTTDGAGYRLQSWSPDGKYMAAIQYGWPPYDQAIVWELKSGKRELLSKRPKQESLTDLFWSQNSAKMYFQRDTSSEYDPNLYVIARTGGKASVQVKGKGERRSYSFSPDNKKLAFLQDNAVYMSNADGSGLRQIMKMDESTGICKPCWSANGRLAFAETIRGEDARVFLTRLHIYDLSSKSQQTIPNVPYNVSEVRWSKDCQWLLLKLLQSGSTDMPDPITGWHMYRREGLLAVSIDGGRQIVFKEPNEETKGLDWIETQN